MRSAFKVRALSVAAVALSAGAISLACAGTAAAAVPAVAYQLNTAHTGVTSDAVSSTGPTKLWTRTLGGGDISYPLIVGATVYVTVANPGSYGTELYALNASTGRTAWGPVDLGGTYDWSGLAYQAGKVFTVNYDGVMQAFSAVTGAPLWALQLPTQYSFSSPPTASGGYVYTGGSGEGGTVYAVSETTGKLAWSAPVDGGDNSSPAVSSKGVWVSYACGQTYDFNPATGAQLWWRNTPCSGGGGKTPVLANGRLYVRDLSYPAVLNAANGKLLSAFAADGPAPAVDSGHVYDLQGSTLKASSVSTGSIVWTFKGDGTLDSAPLVAGGTVLIGASSGKLWALSSSTGKVLWTRLAGSPIPAPDEQNVSQPLTGLASSGGEIVVPAGPNLVAFK